MRLLAIALVLLWVQPASAQPAAPATPEALASAYSCTEIQDNTARLACYDEAIGRLRQAETQGQIVAIDREGVASLRRDSFGFSLPNFARLIPGVGGDPNGADEFDRLEMQVERVNSLRFGRYSFVMANGQTWTQVEPQSVFNVRVGDTVIVRRAAMGSFMLSSSRGGAPHRVRREG